MSISTEKLQIKNTDMVGVWVENYRVRLVENYKEHIYKNWDEQTSLDLTDQFMIEAVMVMNASDEEILDMFFEDAANKCAGMKTEDFLNHVFEAVSQFP